MSKFLIGVQGTLLIVIGWLAYATISWGPHENWAWLALIVFGGIALIVQLVCMGIILWITRGELKEEYETDRAVGIGLPVVSALMGSAASVLA